LKTRILHIAQRQPFFPFLLVLFFVLHGFTENYPIVPVRDASLLLLNYLVIATVTGLFGWVFFRDLSKAAFFAFSILSIQFFFGPVQDMFKRSGHLSFLAKYSVLIPLVLLSILAVILLLRRKKKLPARLVMYLNLSLSLMILLDAAMLPGKFSKTGNTIDQEKLGLTVCKECPLPDIYIIIADSYAGKLELKDIFNYDNSSFEDSLKTRGMFIIDSSISNYNFTYFSVASMLNLEYLKSINGINSNRQDQVVCNSKIRNNIFVNYLRSCGYTIHNNSIFDMKAEPAITSATFLPLKTSLITNQTFTNRIRKDLAYHLATTFRFSSAIKKYTYADRNNNAKVYEMTEKDVLQRSAGPKFVFTHLMMPHYPYYYDSSGKENPFEKLSEENAFNKNLYLGYLQYCNRQLLSLVDKIRNNSSKPPVIILLSDHGFREMKETVPLHYLFQNFVAVSIPEKDSSLFYKGITPVNIYRTLLNIEFRQHLPLLVDSTVLIKD
jgi:hypothetical protein